PNIIHQMSADEQNLTLLSEIQSLQSKMINTYDRKNKIFDIQNIKIILPNAKVGKPYSATIDMNALYIKDLSEYQFSGLNELGLSFNAETSTIEGTPTLSGDIKIKFLFKLIGETEDAAFNEKLINFVINPNPKDLWKDIPSDPNALFAKPDIRHSRDKIGNRNIVAASKRGRSHANVGSFRDDDYAYKHLDNIDWSIVLVSDGAGSASLSREGSRLACCSVIEYFESQLDTAKHTEFEEKLRLYIEQNDEELGKEVNNLSKSILYKAAYHAFQQIDALSKKTQAEHPGLFDNPKASQPIEYFHSTLIFTLFKRFEKGYVFQTFSVGDCPIGLMIDDDKTEMLNWLDVGEFGGGTRFITQADIFRKQDVMTTRFKLKFVEDFKYLFMMSDGIYDPKFVVEANLDKPEKWKEFLSDLEGNNEENIKVELNEENPLLDEQLSAWMDFWSIGNHDDRTLTIVY
ncbi:MAG TPA: PP2C family serine/threonine-protein phosphatase, partial [Bacteroidia bacterium]